MRDEIGALAVEPAESEAADTDPIEVDVQSGEGSKGKPRGQGAEQGDCRFLCVFFRGDVGEIGCAGEVGGDGGARGASDHAAGGLAGGAGGGDE
eukprot:5434535-Pleurochrysis_carterae.AAC.1